jgi:hypothetical protein
MDMNRFTNPSPEYRIHPFWFWNGEMEDEHVREQIEEMHDKGVGGFFLCARQGMTVPYLSKQWFDKVRYAVEVAKSLDMHVWLYDEYPYPSGIAGGEVVLEHPDAKHKTLEHRNIRMAGGEGLDVELPWGRVLYAKAAPVRADGSIDWTQAIDVKEHIGNWQADPIFQKTGLTGYNQKRFFTYRTVFRLVWEAPPGDWEVMVFQEKEIDDFKYYGTFVDPCNREAMETFIRLTHDRYVPAIGEYFGSTVKGMFTDEIGLLGRIPWSPRLPEEFKLRNGYDLLEHLPALLDRSAKDAVKVRYDYYQTIHLLLRESYHLKVHDWCERYGMEYVAEVPAVRMTTQKFSHVPGGDSAHEKLGRSLDWILRRYIGHTRDNPKMVSSLARQLGRTRNLIECFHSVGWSMTLQDARWMVDRLAALGTNFFNFHAFYYTMDALAKHDAPPSQFVQNPYWAHFRTLGDYTGRISYIMTEGKANIRMAFVDPVTSYWTYLANPFHSFHFAGTSEEEKAQLERLVLDWTELGVKLIRNRFDYDHLDPELLGEATVEDGVIRIGIAEYSVLILPPMSNMEAAAWANVRKFLQGGGTVIGLGLLPHDVIEPGSPSEEESMQIFGVTESPRTLYWDGRFTESHYSNGGAHFLPVSTQDGIEAVWPQLEGLLEEASPRPARLKLAQDPQCFLMQTRHLREGEAAIFISNQEGASHDGQLQLDPEALFGAGCTGLRAYELVLETGVRRPMAVKHSGEGPYVDFALAPYQGLLVYVEACSEDAEAPILPQAPDVIELQTDGEWFIRALQDNIVRFDDLTLRIAGEPTGRPVKAKTFIDQCADLAQLQDFPVSFKQTFGTPQRMQMSYPLDAAYSAEFIVEELPERCDIFMDANAIQGDWRLLINGHMVTPDQFKPMRVYDHRNVGCPVASLLKQGVNELIVQLTITSDSDGVTDPFYLKGNFGVAFDEQGRQVIGAAPRSVACLNGGPQPGYPYFAGTMSFRRTIELGKTPEGTEFELSFEDWDPHFHDCAEVIVNGHSLGVRPWTPYRWAGSTDWLHQGDNELEIRVTNTLIGLLEGLTFDYETHTLQRIQG